MKMDKIRYYWKNIGIYFIFIIFLSIFVFGIQYGIKWKNSQRLEIILKEPQKQNIQKKQNIQNNKKEKCEKIKTTVCHKDGFPTAIGAEYGFLLGGPVGLLIGGIIGNISSETICEEKIICQ